MQKEFAALLNELNGAYRWNHWNNWNGWNGYRR